jgi:hypothetical protein
MPKWLEGWAQMLGLWKPKRSDAPRPELVAIEDDKLQEARERIQRLNLRVDVMARRSQQHQTKGR